MVVEVVEELRLVMESDRGAQIGGGVVEVVLVEIGSGSGEKDSYQWRLTMKVEREEWA